MTNRELIRHLFKQHSLDRFGWTIEACEQNFEAGSEYQLDTETSFASFLKIRAILNLPVFE